MHETEELTQIKKITLSRIQELAELRKVFDIDMPSYNHDISPKIRRECSKKYNSILDEYIPNDDDVEILVEIYIHRGSQKAFLNRIESNYPDYMLLLDIK